MRLLRRAGRAERSPLTVLDDVAVPGSQSVVHLHLPFPQLIVVAPFDSGPRCPSNGPGQDLAHLPVIAAGSALRLV